MNNTDIMRKYADILKEESDPFQGQHGPYWQAAEANIERHLGDVVQDPSDTEEIRRQVWQLAHDGAIDAGAGGFDAERIAELIVRKY